MHDANPKRVAGNDDRIERHKHIHVRRPMTETVMKYPGNERKEIIRVSLTAVCSNSYPSLLVEWGPNAASKTNGSKRVLP